MLLQERLRLQQRMAEAEEEHNRLHFEAEQELHLLEQNLDDTEKQKYQLQEDCKSLTEKISSISQGERSSNDMLIQRINEFDGQLESLKVANDLELRNVMLSQSNAGLKAQITIPPEEVPLGSNDTLKESNEQLERENREHKPTLEKQEKRIAELERALFKEKDNERQEEALRTLTQSLPQEDQTKPKKFVLAGCYLGPEAPAPMSLHKGATAVVHESTAYFSSGFFVYPYKIPEKKWAAPLQECSVERFAMVVIDNKLTTIGGRKTQGSTMYYTGTLFSFYGNSWKEDDFPEMKYERLFPAAASTPAHLVVAGGVKQNSSTLIEDRIEVLNIELENRSWDSVSTLPVALRSPTLQMVTCGQQFYLAGSTNVHSCSVEDFLKLKELTTTPIGDIPAQKFTLTMLGERVLAIGGRKNGEPTRDVHRYDETERLWKVILKMKDPKYYVLTAVLPAGEELVHMVVGGRATGCRDTEIFTYIP